MMQSSISIGIQNTSSAAPENGSERVNFIVPIERLRLPNSLNGCQYWAVASNMNSTLGIQSDTQAVLEWLNNYNDRPVTQRTCRSSAEKILLWCVVERGHSLSDLSANEIDLFVNFLANIRPVSRWICDAGTERTSATWRPFSKSVQGPATIEVILSNVKNVVNWFIDQGNLNLSPVLFEIERLKSSFRSNFDRASNFITPHKIQLRQWVLLKQYLPDPNVAIVGPLQILVAAELLFYTGISLKQIHELRWNDIQPIFLNGIVVTWKIPTGHGNKGFVFSIGTLTDNLSKLKRNEKCSRILSKSPRWQSTIIGSTSVRQHTAIKVAVKNAYLRAIQLGLTDDAQVFQNLNLTMIRGGAMQAAEYFVGSKHLSAIYGNLYFEQHRNLSRYIDIPVREDEECSKLANSLTHLFVEKEKALAEFLVNRSITLE